MSRYRAAGAKGFYRRPLAAPPLPLADPDDAYEATQDELEALYLEEARQDRLDDYADRAWPNATIVQFPVRDDEMARAA